MRRVVLALAMTVGLAIGTIVPVSALGETSVTLSCSDGTSVKLLLDADSLTSLTQAVQAMIEYPAGLSCTIIQNPLGVTFGAAALADSPGKNPFIVAGGRWQVSCLAAGFVDVPPALVEGGLVARAPGAWYSLSIIRSSSTLQVVDEFFWVNIAVNVHQKDGTFFGSLNETIPENQSCFGVPVGQSHFASEGPDQDICMTPPTPDVNGNLTTFVTAKVIKTSGQVAFPNVTAGKYVHFGFLDSGNPPGQSTTYARTDKLNGPPVLPGSDNVAGCTGQTAPLPIFNLGTNDPTPMTEPIKQYGNINIHP
jgi:hypothetical protein